MRVIVFDLDDTLYEEVTYVKSGFRAVSIFLYECCGMDPNESYSQMCAILEAEGRGRVFDRTLEMQGRHSLKLAKQCLTVYRSHEPDIRLAPDAARCLDKLAGMPMYIVTDGNKLVQQRKLRALGLWDDPRIRRCFISRRFGIHNEKPSAYCFEYICRLEKTSPPEVMYVGDNPNKDFVGIKPLGFRTVRIYRGSHASLRMAETHEADCTVHNLDELVERLPPYFSIARDHYA